MAIRLTEKDSQWKGKKNVRHTKDRIYDKSRCCPKSRRNSCELNRIGK